MGDRRRIRSKGNLDATYLYRFPEGSSPTARPPPGWTPWRTRDQPRNGGTKVGLMDKVKAQAGQVAQKAQGAAQSGQAKLDQVQEKHRVDGLFRELGAAVYAQRTSSGGPDNAEVERLIKEISSLEA